MFPTKTPSSSFFRQGPSRTLAMVSNATGSYANDTRTEDPGEGLRERERQGGTAKGDKIVVRFVHILHESSIECVESSLLAKFIIRIFYSASCTHQKPVSLQQVCGRRQVDSGVHCGGKPHL